MSDHNTDNLRRRGSSSSRRGRKSIPMQGKRSTQFGSIDVATFFSTMMQEKVYPKWWTTQVLIDWFCELPDNAVWNSFISITVLAAVIVDMINAETQWTSIGFNLAYGVHWFAIGYTAFANRDSRKITFSKIMGLIIDMVSFTHYLNPVDGYRFVCYFVRLHRPFGYLYTLTNYNLKGSVLGTTLKYMYIFMVLRVSWTIVWLLFNGMNRTYSSSGRRNSSNFTAYIYDDDVLGNSSPDLFLKALYLVNKMFIPIGPTIYPQNDIERVICLLVMVTGCLCVMGLAVASLALVISLYMQPEETFRSRYHLIVKEMKDTKVPPNQREKVETFYQMYWNKQKAVHSSSLIRSYPPTLSAIVDADIYFEAHQKSRLLRDCSYEFLSEVAKKMETRRYIPGDAILKRLSKKTCFIYITYGDIEIVTAEDDNTPILRMTRGTILTPYGTCAPAGFGQADVEVRAATFCLAHVLEAKELWKVAIKYGKVNDQSSIILDAFARHMDNVQRHYQTKVPEVVNHKSSIMHFKRCLIALKEARDANGDLLLARTDVFLEISGCYLMRNRDDSSLTDEADAICLRPTFPCILQPASSLQFVWNFFVASVILTVCFVHPYYLVFTQTVPTEFRFFDYVVTIIFALDLFVYLSTGTHVEEGIAITFAQTSSQQMKNPWFMVDVVATVPIFEFLGTGHFAGINKLLRLHKVFRVLKGIEVLVGYSSSVMRFLSYTLLMVIACYLTAALQQGFMCFRCEYCRVTNLTHSPYWSKQPLDREGLEARLYFGLYWGISMITFTTHMETFGLTDWQNMIYTLFVVEISIVIRIFMEAVYSATIITTTALRENYDSAIELVNSCFVRNQLDPLLCNRFITYLKLCWYTDKAYHMTTRRNIFYDLPPHVYTDIVARQRNKYLLAIPIMKFASYEELKEISSKARLFYTSPNEILINTGDITSEMYVLMQGMCEVICPDKKQTVTLLTTRHHFGVLICLLSIPAYYTVRAVTHVRVFSISLKNLARVLENPHIKHTLSFLKEQPEYVNLQQRREPFIQYEPLPPIPNKEKFLLPRKHEPDYAFLSPFHRLGFLSILRYIFPRYTIRPDGKYLARYEWCRAACAFASAMVFPNYTYLVLWYPSLYYVAIFLDLSAYADIIQRMLVGYYTPDGILVYHPASTAAHYAKGAFFVDMLGCLPWENLEGEYQAKKGLFVVTLTEQLLMMGRLFQLYRLNGAMISLYEFIERRDLIMVLRAIPVFLVMLHVQTCFMVLYSTNIYYSPDRSIVIIEPKNDTGGSWLHVFSDRFRFNLTENLWNLHLGMYFWATYELSTTGYNILNPSNNDIVISLFIAMIASAMAITYFSVGIISIRANVNKALANFQEHMKDIVAYLKKENLDISLQKEVFDYYEYNWDKMGGVDYHNIFKLCDQMSLRTDAILHIYGSTFAECPVLQGCDVSLLRIIGREVHSSHWLRRMHIIYDDDVIPDMYFIDHGGVEARFTSEYYHTADNLGRGSIFGNLEGTPTVRCTFTFVATTRTHLLRINGKVFHEILKNFPKVQKAIDEWREDSRFAFYIKGGGTGPVKPFRDRTLSKAIINRSRSGFIKYLYFKDNYIQFSLIVISLLCIYTDVYNAGFQVNSPGLLVMLYTLDLFFLLKMALYLTLPFIGESKQAQEVLYPRRRLYIKTDLKFDILSCVPFELLAFIETEDYERRWILYSWFRLNRILRFWTVYKSLKRYREHITVSLSIITVWSVAIWFTLSVHMVTCLWYFMAVLEEKQEQYSSWIYKDDKSSWCDNEYICSLYFVLTTFTQNGVGDIMPRQQIEVIFVCFLQLVSMLAYMIYVGEFSNIIQYQSFRSFYFYSQYLELQDFLKNNRVSRNLVKEVNKYGLHLWRESRGLQSPHFLHVAPLALRLTVMSCTYMHHIGRHYVFEKCEPAFLRQLVGCFRIYSYSENMFVVKTGEITNSMYFIHRGKVEEKSETRHTPRTYPPGTGFGVLQGLLRDCPYRESYRASRNSQVLTLCMDDWEYLLAHYPFSADVIAVHRGDDDSPFSGIRRHRSSGTSTLARGTSPSQNRPQFQLPSRSAMKSRASESPTHETPTRDTSARRASARETTAQEISAQVTPTEETEAETTLRDVVAETEKEITTVSVNEVPLKEKGVTIVEDETRSTILETTTPTTQENPTKETPIQDVSTQETPTQGIQEIFPDSSQNPQLEDGSSWLLHSRGGTFGRRKSMSPTLFDPTIINNTASEAEIALPDTVAETEKEIANVSVDEIPLQDKGVTIVEDEEARTSETAPTTSSEGVRATDSDDSVNFMRRPSKVRTSIHLFVKEDEEEEAETSLLHRSLGQISTLTSASERGSDRASDKEEEMVVLHISHSGDKLDKDETIFQQDPSKQRNDASGMEAGLKESDTKATSTSRLKKKFIHVRYDEKPPTRLSEPDIKEESKHDDDKTEEKISDEKKDDEKKRDEKKSDSKKHDEKKSDKHK